MKDIAITLSCNNDRIHEARCEVLDICATGKTEGEALLKCRNQCRETLKLWYESFDMAAPYDPVTNQDYEDEEREIEEQKKYRNNGSHKYAVKKTKEALKMLDRISGKEIDSIGVPTKKHYSRPLRPAVWAEDIVKSSVVIEEAPDYRITADGILISTRQLKPRRISPVYSKTSLSARYFRVADWRTKQTIANLVLADLVERYFGLEARQKCEQKWEEESLNRRNNKYATEISEPQL